MGRLAVLVAVSLAVVASLPGSGGAGSPVTCYSRAATIVGTEGPETLTGTGGNDVIAGLGGDDTINGNGGRDFICPGDGADTVNGGAGLDNVEASDGNDIAERRPRSRLHQLLRLAGRREGQPRERDREPAGEPTR